MRTNSYEHPDLPCCRWSTACSPDGQREAAQARAYHRARRPYQALSQGLCKRSHGKGVQQLRGWVARMRRGPGWIPGAYPPCTGRKRWIFHGFFRRCRIGRAPVAGLSQQSVTPNMIHDNPGSQYKLMRIALTGLSLTTCLPYGPPCPPLMLSSTVPLAIAVPLVRCEKALHQWVHEPNSAMEP
jgi:hypothetical protein